MVCFMPAAKASDSEIEEMIRKHYSYSAIQKQTGASPNRIAKLVKKLADEYYSSRTNKDILMRPSEECSQDADERDGSIPPSQQPSTPEKNPLHPPRGLGGSMLNIVRQHPYTSADKLTLVQIDTIIVGVRNWLKGMKWNGKVSRLNELNEALDMLTDLIKNF